MVFREQDKNSAIFPFVEQQQSFRLSLNQTSQEVQERGYIDMFDKAVIDQVFAPNPKFELGGVHFDTTADKLRRKVVDVESLFDVGVTVGHDICNDHASARGKIAAYLNTAIAIDVMKVGISGYKGDTTTSNGIIDNMRLPIAGALPRKASTGQLFEVINETFERRKEHGEHREQYTWLQTKLVLLQGAFQRELQLTELSERYEASRVGDDLEHQTLTRQSTLLTKEAMEHRKYGTKPAYTEASIGGSWVFYDGMDWVKSVTRSVTMGKTDQYHNIAAVVWHTPHTELKSLKLDFSRDDSGMVQLSGGMAAYEPDLLIYITKDGSMSLDPNGIQDLSFSGIEPVRELALRAELSSNFYDLSMPIYKNRPNHTNFASLTNPERETFDPIQDLLIPRIRFLGQQEFVQDETTDVVRTVRAHDVTWFVRTLPHGWHASPEAQSMAEAHGIVLDENETFVKSHSRGEKNKVMAYHAIRR